MGPANGWPRCVFEGQTGKAMNGKSNSSLLLVLGFALPILSVTKRVFQLGSHGLRHQRALDRKTAWLDDF